MTTSVDTVSLSAFGNIPAAYRHKWKVAEPRPPVVLPGAIFKWYLVYDEGASVPAELDDEARAAVAEAAASGEWDLSYGLNFVVLHQTTTHAYLIAGVWRGHNELWERGYYKELGRPGTFARVEPDGGATAAACVWELGPICHERMAWHRYLFSERTDADKRAWLTDTYTGRV